MEAKTFEDDYVSKVLSGDILPCEFYKINDDKTGLIQKTETEILADDTTTINGYCEVRNYCRLTIQDYKNDLSSTDYIIQKICEAQAESDDTTVTELKTTYATELANRKTWRAKINELQAVLDKLVNPNKKEDAQE